MAWMEVFTCDWCGKTKGATNHWWEIWDYGEGFSVAPFSASTADGCHHFCGDEHLLKQITELLKKAQ